MASSRILGRDKVALFGALGSDFIADKQLEILRNEGILTNLVQFNKEVVSGQAYIIVDSDGRNAIMTFRQANDSLSHKMLESKNMSKYIVDSSLVTVVDPPLAVTEKIILMTASNQKIVWAPGLLSSSGIGNVMDVIKNVDYLILNESDVLLCRAFVMLYLGVENFP